MGMSEGLTAWPIRCTNCGRPPPPRSYPHACPTCGGIYDLAQPIAYAPPGPASGGLARFRATFPLPPEADLVSLGEGGTPLIPATVLDRTFHFKCEHLSPTGSFKDRGSAVLVSTLAAAGIDAAIEDSSGNAGASFAAYCARAGIRARVFVPDGASPRKLEQIAAYGAEVVRILGPRSAVAEAARREAGGGVVYASHAWLPLGLAGLATLAYELVEQLGREPGAVVMPLGHGTLLLGLARGFEALHRAGVVEGVPKLVGVQAAACAPLWAVYQGGPTALTWVREGDTRAEGVRVLQPMRGDAVLAAVEASRGTVVAVDEPGIVEGEAELAHRGFYVEPTSALVWGGLISTLSGLPDPVVVILTGSGLKTEPSGGSSPPGRRENA